MITAAGALWASIVRTVVPIIVGAALGWLTARGITVDPEFEELFTAFLVAGFSAAWFIVSRLLELYVAPRLGWLLGLAKQPVYVAPTTNAATNQNATVHDPTPGTTRADDEPPLDRVEGPDHRAE